MASQELSFAPQRHLPTEPTSLREPTKTPPHRDSSTTMSATDAAVRHQAVVPDKVPTGEYPVSLHLKYECNG
jgi:hypothetical protein